MGAIIHSMTGFAALSGTYGGLGWDWDIRSVNARGLDIRLRLADGFDALEIPLRSALAAALTRGSVSISLKLARRSAEAAEALSVSGLQAAFALVASIGARAREHGLSLAPLGVGDLLKMPGVLDGAGAFEVPSEAISTARAQIPALIAALNAMRAGEGAALQNLMQDQLAKLTALTNEARHCAEARNAAAGVLLQDRVAALLLAARHAEPGLDAARLAQELALLAVKTDITEEIDRLETHIAAAHALFAAGGALGRRLDFLMQEFNREANTLCAKAQSSDLTRIGLAQKVIIDQMREQAQNLE